MPHSTPWSWLENHPFAGPVLDMQPFALGVRARADEATLRQFEDLRSTDPRSLGTKSLQHPQRVETQLSYPVTPQAPPAAVFRASRLEEKWDIDHHDGRLWFRRSWTGDLAMQAVLHQAGDTMIVTEVLCDEAWCDAPPAAQVDFLIWTHLIGRPVPHPVPKGALENPERAAVWSFGRFGHMAWWATEQDVSATVRRLQPRTTTDAP